MCIMASICSDKKYHMSRGVATLRSYEFSKQENNQHDVFVTYSNP